jgi:hypothetical protein
MEERAEQVKIMGEIYKSAARVVVWLDDETLTPRQLSEALFLLREIKLGVCANVAIDQPSTTGIGRPSQWHSLYALLSHRYWYRVWIIQEISVATKVEVLYGHSYISWNEFSEAIILISSSPDYIQMRSLQDGYNQMHIQEIFHGSLQISFLWEKRREVAGGDLRSLTECITKMRYCVST